MAYLWEQIVALGLSISWLFPLWFSSLPTPGSKDLELKMTSIENSQSSALSSSNVDVDDQLEKSASSLLNNGDPEPKREFTEEEVRNILEVIASTGKFWLDWDILKEILSFRLKQVLAQYPESQMASDVIGPQPSSLSGETYQELVKRLDEALLSFIEGPPFTLQRICEILLTPQTIYSTLSKLALALEKNLLVTSTLTVCTEPYPSTTMQNTVESEEGNQAPQAHLNEIENDVEAMISDGDEELANTQADEDNKRTDMDATEKKMGENIAETSETSPEPTTISDPSEASPSIEKLNPATS
ncbi:hypothetical protein MRB53_006192 [Persea americana]|uniref:Uncharacterized protein n=1 Tax=Persea americana TaxID=3435 RepID=A0ACC2MGH2_PERAE|nr:hypothetical protein MRB53_006192 [Persea americana]